LNPWPGKSASIIDSDNKQVTQSASGDKIIFPTKPGESYTLKNFGISVKLTSNPELFKTTGWIVCPLFTGLAEMPGKVLGLTSR